MAELFYAAAVLACPVGMGAMMWFMMRGHRQQPAAPSTPPAGEAGVDGELARLRAEVDQLRAAQRDGSEEPTTGAAVSHASGEAI